MCFKTIDCLKFTKPFTKLLTHSWPFSVHSLGGKIEFRISSVCWLLLASTGGSFLLGGVGTGPDPGGGEVDVTFKALD